MNNRYAILDYLRGIAALAVVFCHLRHALPSSAAELFKHGELGVYLFFVISGFIIPYSMMKSGYQLKHLGLFWLKRLLRLQPTFIAALLLTFALSHLAARYKGEVSAFSAHDLLKSVFYLHIPGENIVIWTLVIELKYYLFISILFPLLFAQNKALRLASFLICCLCSVLLGEQFPAIRFLPFFLMGFAACYLACKQASLREAAGLAIIAAIVALPGVNWLQISTGILTTALIVWNPPINLKAGLLLGSISYSLYLVHFPIAVKFMNFILPRLQPDYHFLVFLAGAAISVICAWVVYMVIEAPSAKWAQAIKFTKPTPAPEPGGNPHP